MYIDQFRDFCLSLPETTESMPFDDRVLVFKVNNKMFALTDLPDFVSINLKCDPNLAIERREEYQAVETGYHMNKKHWNTIAVNSDVSDKLLYEWILESWHLVVQGMKDSDRNRLLSTLQKD